MSSCILGCKLFRESYLNALSISSKNSFLWDVWQRWTNTLSLKTKVTMIYVVVMTYVNDMTYCKTKHTPKNRRHLVIVQFLCWFSRSDVILHLVSVSSEDILERYQKDIYIRKYLENYNIKIDLNLI